MSKNIQSLTARRGLKGSLFNRMVATGPDASSGNDGVHQQLAKDYFLGESITHGTASFYDFLKEEDAGKKAYVCNGSACLCAGTQQEVTRKLGEVFSIDEIGHMTCLGRCHENSSFHINGNNYSGDDIDSLKTLIDDPSVVDEDGYHVQSDLDPPILTAPFPGIEDYFSCLKDLLQQPQDHLLQEVKDSILRGRGGAGFPTGFKWDACKQAPGDTKYIVCNADEGDPGAYIDRYLLEKRPHSVLFGMLIAGYVVGANEGALYIRAEYPDSVTSIQDAIDEMEKAGYAGDNIACTGFSFHFTVVKGAGAYICGEETSLLASIEGNRPEVQVRPPYPTTHGLYGKPTIVNNVETLACIHTIVNEGGKFFASIGTSKTTGPKLISLDGLFNRPGLYEIRVGTPLSDVIDRLGQGFRKPVKAIQIGGPLGGIVPKEKFSELTIDFESFRDKGFLLGHASFVSIPEDMPIIQYLEHLFEFCAFESCGKCFPCRIGAKRGQEMLRTAMDDGAKFDKALLEDLLETMELGSLCAHGGGIPLPIRNSLQYFDDEMKPYYRTGTES
jgi:NADH:ubiquinone oxidoreductase subunit F (NADH-binding)